MFGKDYIQTFFASALQGFTTILLPLLFSQIWHKEQFGIFCFLLVNVSLAQIIIDYGFSIQTVKLINDSPQRSYQIISDQLKAKHTITMVVLTIFFFIIYFSNYLQPKSTFIFLLTSAVAYSYGIFLTFPFQALKNFKQANLMTIFSNTIYLIVVLPAFIFPEISPAEVSILFLIGRILGLGINIYFAKEFLIKSFILKGGLIGKELKQGFPFAMLFFFGFAYFQIDTFFIKEYLGYESIALYQIGIRIVMMMAFITGVFNIVALPYINKIKKDEGILYKVKQNVVDLLTFYGGAGGIALLVFSKESIQILGHTFEDLLPYLPLFGLIILIRNFGSGFSLLMTILDYQKVRSSILLGACVIAIISNALLIPTFALWGALESVLITLFFINISYQIIIYQEIEKTFISRQIISIFIFYIAIMFCFYKLPGIFDHLRFVFLFLYGILHFRKMDFKYVLSL